MILQVLLDEVIHSRLVSLNVDVFVTEAVADVHEEVVRMCVDM